MNNKDFEEDIYKKETCDVQVHSVGCILNVGSVLTEGLLMAGEQPAQPCVSILVPCVTIQPCV